MIEAKRKIGKVLGSKTLFVGLNAIDLGFTTYNLGAYGATEVNFVPAAVYEHYGAVGLIALKALAVGYIFGSIVTIEKINFPKTAKVLTGILNVGFAAVVLSDINQFGPAPTP